MFRNRIGKSHVVRSLKPGKDILACKIALHEYVKKNVYKTLKGKGCQFLDDIVGDTFLDIAEYSKNFDKNLNITPETFINKRLNGSIIDNYIKYLQTIKTPRSNSWRAGNEYNEQSSYFSNSFYNSVNPISFGDDENIEYIEKNLEQDYQPQSPENKIHNSDLCRMKDEILDFIDKEFKERDRNIFKLRFLKNLTQREVAKKIGKTHQSISEREKVILKKINLKFPQKLSHLNV